MAGLKKIQEEAEMRRRLEAAMRFRLKSGRRVRRQQNVQSRKRMELDPNVEGWDEDADR